MSLVIASGCSSTGSGGNQGGDRSTTPGGAVEGGTGAGTASGGSGGGEAGTASGGSGGGGAGTASGGSGGGGAGTASGGSGGGRAGNAGSGGDGALGVACSPTCTVGESCVTNADCVLPDSGKCTADQCAGATCTDRVKNGNETDVDCGAGCESCSCARLYLGNGRLTDSTADTSNTAIALVNDTIAAGSTVFIQVVVSNHGTDDSPSSLLELYWTNPSTGYAITSQHLIGTGPNIIVPGATVSLSGQIDGQYAQNFSWTPDPGILATNGGHVALLARVSNNTSPPQTGCLQQTYDTSSPTTDLLTAVHDVQIVASP